VLQKPLRAVTSGHASTGYPCDLSCESAGAAADVEDVVPGRDPGGPDEDRDPEAEVVLREPGIEMLGRKPLGTELDRVDSQ
jgi:hypothetical protein